MRKIRMLPGKRTKKARVDTALINSPSVEDILDEPTAVTVYKFGGTSMSQIKKVVGIIKYRVKEDPKLVLVCSAFSDMTDTLYTIIDDKITKKHKLEMLSGIMSAHLGIVDSQLRYPSSREACTKRIRKIYSSVYSSVRKSITQKGTISEMHKAYILSIGERFSCMLLEAMLNERKINAKCFASEEIIKTKDASYRKRKEPKYKYIDAEISMPETKNAILDTLVPAISEGIIPIIPGFIGSNSEGSTTTLGRNGSDLSASVIASALQQIWNISDTYRLSVKELGIWTDVDGWLSADPSIVEKPILAERMSYEEASKLSAFGTNVLHPDAIRPAIVAGIPVRIRNTFHPRCLGTVIQEDIGATRGPLTGITSKPCSIVKTKALSSKAVEAPGYLVKLFSAFSRLGIAIELVSTDQNVVSSTIEPGVDCEKIGRLIKLLEKVASVSVEKGFSIIYLTGEGIRSYNRIFGRTTSVMDKANITIRMLSLVDSAISIGFVVKEEDKDLAIRLLHKEFFEQSYNKHG